MCLIWGSIDPVVVMTSPKSKCSFMSLPGWGQLVTTRCSWGVVHPVCLHPLLSVRNQSCACLALLVFFRPSFLTTITFYLSWLNVKCHSLAKLSISQSILWSCWRDSATNTMSSMRSSYDVIAMCFVLFYIAALTLSSRPVVWVGFLWLWLVFASFFFDSITAYSQRECAKCRWWRLR
jgi:hypothetical protein